MNEMHTHMIIMQTDATDPSLHWTTAQRIVVGKSVFYNAFCCMGSDMSNDVPNFQTDLNLPGGLELETSFNDM
jgi:hypothetical protein